MVKKRPEIRSDADRDSEGHQTWTHRARELRRTLAATSAAVRQRIGAACDALYNHTAVTAQTIREGGAVTREKVHRPTRPSETIDDDVSTGAVFLVVIMLLIVVAAALFFAISSTYPSFTSPL